MMEGVNNTLSTWIVISSSDPGWKMNLFYCWKDKQAADCCGVGANRMWAGWVFNRAIRLK